jgi:hypothetical protein
LRRAFTNYLVSYQEFSLPVSTRDNSFSSGGSAYVHDDRDTLRKNREWRAREKRREIEAIKIASFVTLASSRPLAIFGDIYP